MMLFRKQVLSAIRIPVYAASLVFCCPAWVDAPHVRAEPPTRAKPNPKEPSPRVGQIFIIGNTITRDAVILRQVPFKPGDKFTLSDLRAVQRNLARLQLFKKAPAPCVRVLDENRDKDDVFKDICIEVAERDCNAFFWALQESLEFIGIWTQWGLQAAILRSEPGTFPNELLHFALSGNKDDLPLAIRYYFVR
ncbi:MAG TPA: POTRA domain-containing protein [Gemmataceae bacterium]|nr:POTRA domain-containing protein [Gemmataceae bacterium]